MLHWRLLRFASTLAAFALLLALAACGGGRMVPAPVGPPQSPDAAAKPPRDRAGGRSGRKPLPPPAPGRSRSACCCRCPGANAELGKAMLEAAQLALFATGRREADAGAARHGRTAAAPPRRRARRSPTGRELILGPLLAAEVEAVRPIARRGQGQHDRLRDATQVAGGNVFLMGFLPRQEVAREVSFARERGAQAVRRAGAEHALRPADDRRAARDGARGRRHRDQGRISRSARRRRRGGGRSGCAGAGPAGRAPSSTRCCCREGGDQLKQIARQLKAAGLGAAKVRLLGSGLWDDPSIAGEPALYGGWFAASPLDPRREFESRFQATYGRAPPRLASLAFDAAALAAVLAKAAGPSRSRSEAILNPSGFTGVDGLFRFTDQGLVQRGLAVLEVTPQGNGRRQPGAAELPRPRVLTVAREERGGELPLLAKAAALG